MSGLEYLNATPCIMAPGCPGLVPFGFAVSYCSGCGRRHARDDGKVIGSGNEIAVGQTATMLRNNFAYHGGDIEALIKAIWNGKERY